MDPITALQVASAVVQLVDFGSKLVGVGIEIAESAKGATKENILNKYLITNTQEIFARLQKRSSVQSPTTGGTSRGAFGMRASSPDLDKLQELAKTCEGVAQDLVDVLEDVGRETSFKSWTLVRRTIKTVCKEGKVASLQQRIERVKSEISLLLLCMISEDQSMLSMLINDANQRSEQLRIQQAGELKALRADIMTELASQDRTLASITAGLHQLNTQPSPGSKVRGTHAMVQQLGLALDGGQNTASPGKNAIWQLLSDAGENAAYFTIFAAAANKHQEALMQLRSRLEALVMRSEDDIKRLRILESLDFPEIDLRELEVETAFPNTFVWLMDAEHSDLLHWLRKESGIFWVSGKPGAGKSTLMKFVTSHSKTADTLKEWYGDCRLAVANHFFWSTGTQMQKSQQGLIQSLLFQLLRQLPELVQETCAARWNVDNNLWEKPARWELQELKKSFDLTLCWAKSHASKFCFFLDGLDEYAEDQWELIVNFIQHYAEVPNVKFCVSSRPHNVFNNAFGNSPKRKIVLEDLTVPDMDEFIRGRLEQDPRFKQLAAIDNRAVLFAQEIRRRADGVFLWVHVVIVQLLSGMIEGDNIPTLQKRLDDLPREMIKLYKHIMDQIDPFYRLYSARSLLLAHEASEPLPFMTFWFLQEEIQHRDVGSRTKVAPLTKSDLDVKRQEVAQYLSKWCKGLLELARAPRNSSWNTWEPLRETTVHFHHRTVKDFLHTADMAAFVRESAGPTFNVNQTLANLFLAQAKSANVYGLEDEMQSFVAMANQAKGYAAAFDNEQPARSHGITRNIVTQLQEAEAEIQRLRDSEPIIAGMLQVPSKAARSRSVSPSTRSRSSKLFRSFRKGFDS